jgi:hypothetical protein
LVFGTAYAVALLRVLRTFWVQALPEVDGGFVQSWRFEVDSGQGIFVQSWRFEGPRP